MELSNTLTVNPSREWRCGSRDSRLPPDGIMDIPKHLYHLTFTRVKHILVYGQAVLVQAKAGLSDK